ncbi:MAG: tetratricopeptide repeat protein, partial [Saprospiraceae bacterium]|nr:tetratricopeptide repeat protein [Saprospiraceae bacterium]
AAFQLAQEVLRQGEKAGDTAYPEARYDGATAHFRMGRVLKMAGHSEQALPFLQAAERRFEVLANEGNADAARMASVCLTEIGDCFSALGQYNEAAKKYEAGIELADKLGDMRGIAVKKNQLATVRMQQKNYSEALRLYGEAKTIFEEYREPGQVAVTWHQIGMVHQKAQNYPAAEKAYLESLTIKIREKNKSGEASTLIQLGNLYKLLERLEDAVRVHERATEIYVELKDLRYEGITRSNLADTLFQLHRTAEARTQLLRAIKCKSQFGHVAEPWKTWAILCDLETAEGNLPAAAAARQQALQAYAAYRLAGGESQSNQFRLIVAAAQALQVGQQAQMVDYLQSTLEPGDPTEYVALVRRLTALLRGSRDPAVADDPELDYMNVVELRLVFFGGGGAGQTHEN